MSGVTAFSISADGKNMLYRAGQELGDRQDHGKP